MKNHFGGTFFDIFGSIFKGFGTLIFGIIRLLLKCLLFFGLWVPLLYAVLGVILYYVCHFDIFDFSTYSILYLSGGVACVVCMIIITITNAIVRPAKKAFSADPEQEKIKKERRKKKPSSHLWDKQKAAVESDTLSPPLSESFMPEKKSSFLHDVPSYLPTMPPEEPNETVGAEDPFMDWLPIKKTPEAKPQVVKQPKMEKPKIYFSTLRPDILVYEYSDRFELYRISGDNKAVHVGVEFKV